MKNITDYTQADLENIVKDHEKEIANQKLWIAEGARAKKDQ